ncbi:MAG: putative metal-binding motif-containing protein, partial [Pseudomonadota bacterium]
MLLRRGLFILLLAGFGVWGCASTEFFENGVDVDEDGFDTNVDCDDNDKLVHPGAEERENCIDDDCDGETDEGTPNWDADRDGYCISIGDTGECEGNPLRHPGMAEDGGDGSGNANGIDDNCNGVVDEGLRESDVDEDGFKIKDGDCNDDDPTISPGAVEVEGILCREDKDCPSGKSCYDNYCRCEQFDEECSSSKPCTKDEECGNGETCQSKICQSSWKCLEAQPDMASPELMVCRDNKDN